MDVKTEEMDVKTEERAKSVLRSALEKLLGPSLPGVNGFGVGLDRRTRELGLEVRVGERVARRLGQDLPPEICGLPVRISVASAARLD